MLNINEASVDLFGKHVDLKILLKIFSFLVAQYFRRQYQISKVRL